MLFRSKKDKDGKVITEKVKLPRFERSVIISNVAESTTQVAAYVGAGGFDYYAVVINSGALVRYIGRGEAGPIMEVLRYTEGLGVDALFGIHGSKLYFSSGGPVASIELGASRAPELLISSIAAINNFTVDIAADMIWFLGSSLEQKDFTMELREESVGANYMYFKQLNGSQNTPQYFIGVVGADELPEEEE